MPLLLFTLQIISPIFILILLGIFLRRTGLVNEIFVSQSSKFVFTISLPALIFLKIDTVTIGKAFDGKLILTSLILVFIFAMISWFISTIITKTPQDKGVFIQGSFRSNFAIIGLAVIASLVGENQLGKASLVLAFIMPLYNILAVVALTVPFKNERDYNLLQLLKQIITNPLILAAIAAVPFSVFHINIGNIFTTTIGYLAKIALPLALVSIGASLNIKRLKNASQLAFTAAGLKLILFPLIAVPIGLFLNFNSVEIVIIFVLFASPTAIVSFIMADAMGGNSKLASDIVAVSTLFSIITLSFGIFILKYFSLL